MISACLSQVAALGVFISMIEIRDAMPAITTKKEQVNAASRFQI
jgi:hypothetical protein